MELVLPDTIKKRAKTPKNRGKTPNYFGAGQWRSRSNQVGQNTYWVQIEFCLENNIAPKLYLVQKNFCSEKICGPTNCYAKKLVKKMWAKKKMGQVPNKSFGPK